MFYKLKFHPGDPDSVLIQRLWRSCVLQPPGKPHLSKLRNQFGDFVKIDRLCIAYSRHLNIGNLLSYRKICNRPGPKVSSFIWLDMSRPLFIFHTAGPAFGSSAAAWKTNPAFFNFCNNVFHTKLTCWPFDTKQLATKQTRITIFTAPKICHIYGAATIC